MYVIRPPAVFIHSRVERDQRCLDRVTRMLTGIRYEGEPVIVDDAGLNDLCEAHGWSNMAHLRTGETGRTGDPAIIFNTFTWASEEEHRDIVSRYPHLRHGYLSGTGAWTFRNGRATLQTHSGVCTDAYELHSAWGCLHICDYCNVLDYLNIMVNLEELVERFARLSPRPLAQALEVRQPHRHHHLRAECGASRLMVELFLPSAGPVPDDVHQERQRRSPTPLDHRGKTIICWSMAPATQSRLIEKGSATTSQRIEAAAKCQKAGYTVRARFSPIVPVRELAGWSTPCSTSCSPPWSRTSLTIDTLKWTEPARVWSMFDKHLWDDEYAAYVDRFAAMAPEDRPYPVLPNGKQLFPHEARVAMYRLFTDRIRELSPRTRIAFCGETPEIWREFQHEVGMTPQEYVCACGPTSVPGHRLFAPEARSTQ